MSDSEGTLANPPTGGTAEGEQAALTFDISDERVRAIAELPADEQADALNELYVAARQELDGSPESASGG